MKELQKTAPVVSLIGRPNVGKSSIFNRLLGQSHKALTHDQPGVTRDRNYAFLSLLKWAPHLEERLQGGQDIILVDTGGFYPQTEDPHLSSLKEWANVSAKEKEELRGKDLFSRLSQQAQLGIQESDLVLVVVDIREGLSPYDKMIVDQVRQRKKPFLVLVNKLDSPKQEGDENQFYALGVDTQQLIPVSAAHGYGLLDLKQQIIEWFLAWETSSNAHDVLKGVLPGEKVVGKLAIIGAPNAGKSTLLNQLLGHDRALVSPIPGTTVDPVHGHFDLFFGEQVNELENPKEKTHEGIKDEIVEEVEKVETFEVTEEVDETEVMTTPTSSSSSGKNYWRSLQIIDTAGIRKKSAIHEFVEAQSTYRALRTIEESDVVIYLVDATKGISRNDCRLCEIVLEKGKSLILCLNKMDMLEKNFKDAKEKRLWLDETKNEVTWLNFCEILPLSAKTGQYIKKLKEVIKKTILVRRKKVPTGPLNQLVHDMVEKTPLVLGSKQTKKFKVKYVTMVKSDPPTFLMFSNLTQKIPQSYRRYLVRGIREKFGFKNTPVHLIFRNP